MFSDDCNPIEKITSCIDFVKRQKIKDRSIMLPEQLKSLEKRKQH